MRATAAALIVLAAGLVNGRRPAGESNRTRFTLVLPSNVFCNELFPAFFFFFWLVLPLPPMAR